MVEAEHYFVCIISDQHMHNRDTDDVINHNGHKIDRSKPIWFCYMQGWRRLSRGADIITGLSRRHPSVTAQRVLKTTFMQKSQLKYAFLPSKIVEVWIDRFCVRYDWCPRRDMHRSDKKQYVFWALCHSRMLVYSFMCIILGLTYQYVL